MSRYSGNNDRCPVCGIRYRDFRCAEITSWQEALESMWSASDNPKDWRNKRKGGVLGYWYRQKQREWDYHIETCKPVGQDLGISEKDLPY